MKELLILKICKILALLKILDFDKVNKENTCGFYQGPMIIFYFGKRQLCVCNDPEGIPSDDCNSFFAPFDDNYDFSDISETQRFFERPSADDFSDAMRFFMNEDIKRLENKCIELTSQVKSLENLVEFKDCQIWEILLKNRRK